MFMYKKDIRSEISKIENANIFFSYKSCKNARKLFYHNIFLSCYYWHVFAPLLKFWDQKTKKVYVIIF